MILRWTIAFLAIGIFAVAVQSFERNLTPETVLDPQCALSLFPREFEVESERTLHWVSTADEDENDERIFISVGADSVSNRRYRARSNETVSMHMAVFKSFGEWTPHLPTICYEGAGWDIISKKPITLKHKSASIQAMLFTALHDGERHRVLYYYQRAPYSYHNADQARACHQEMWGQKEWPPLVKVMLQTLEDDPERADERLISIAKICADWCESDTFNNDAN